MKLQIVMSLMAVIVLVFLYLKNTGKIRLSELDIVPELIIRLMLLIVSSGFFFILLAKLLRATWGYDASPLSILIYGAALLAAIIMAFHSTRWLMR